jgi:hypothetical protein
VPRPEVAGVLTSDDLRTTGATIAAAQEPDGAVPWFPGGQVDPWDHVEAAMALDVAGLVGAAGRAYEWLRLRQRADGSWAASYRAGAVDDSTADANFAAYVAVGTWHHYLITGSLGFLRRMWPTVQRALAFVVGLQAPGGEIRWARDASGCAWPHALLTGCSSMYQSLRCALAIAERLGDPQPDWELAAGRLGHALVRHPERFAPKARFSMDWYYPVLGGALRGPDAEERIAASWKTFVVPGLGIRCVADRPWVTGAETCELVLALDALGDREGALRLFADMQHLRDADGAYWTGYVYPDDAFWPGERSTWTAAAVLLAADALSDATPAAGIFRGDALPAGVDLDDAACDDRMACAPSLG